MDAIKELVTKLHDYNPSSASRITHEIIDVLATEAIKSFRQQGTLIAINNLPVHVVGVVHGQLRDVQRIYDMIGRPPAKKFIYLGDYVCTYDTVAV